MGSGEGSYDPPPRPRLLGDEAELFQSYSQRLRRIVQRLVNTSPDIVDDACNYAWMEFIWCQPDRDGGWRAWLVTTAQREAWRLDGKERAHFGFEVEGLGEELAREAADPRDVVGIRSELRFALDVFATLSERRREVKALFTALLALVTVELASITGFSSDEANLLAAQPGAELSVHGLVLAGIVIAALGVLDDVTISQASTVLALRRANPAMGMRRLFREAMTVGRDHMGATVNTLVLAYVGASLPVLLVFASTGTSFADAVNREVVAQEIVATLVGSIGLVAAVPLTTALAALLAARVPARQLPAGRHAH